MSDVERLFYEIQQLPIHDLLRLRDLMRDLLDEGEGGAGVREPRAPAPESPGDQVALEEGL